MTEAAAFKPGTDCSPGTPLAACSTETRSHSKQGAKTGGDGQFGPNSSTEGKTGLVVLSAAAGRATEINTL